MHRTLDRSRVEILLTLLALLWLVWQGRVLGEADLFRGADDRYRRDLQLKVELSPELGRADGVRQVCDRFYDYLPGENIGLCAEYRKPTGWARIKDTLLPSQKPDTAPRPAKPTTAQTVEQARQMLQSLENVHVAWSRSFYQRLETTQQQREQWEEQARVGFIEEGWREQFDNLLKETQTYRETYQLAVRHGSAYSRPVECAWSFLSRRVNEDAVLALLGLAAVMDGDGDKLPAGAFPPKQEWNAAETKMGCRGSILETAREGAEVIDTARASAANASKAGAVLGVLPHSRWQLMVWALAGLLVSHLGRRAVLPNRMLFAALLVWSVAAALTRPQLQWLGGGAEIGWLAGSWKPALWLFIAACLCLALPWKQPAPLALPASALGYPGFVLFAGLSWWLLLDLSANGYFDNRFQGLYQQGNVFAAFVLVSMLPALRIPLARLGLRVLGFWALVAVGRNLRAGIAWLLATFGMLALLGAIVVLLKSHRFFTSEIFRACLIGGLSWFLLARADKLVSPWLRPPFHPPGWRSRLACHAVRLKLAMPLLLLLVFVVGGLKLTDDNGPLLVVLYFGSVLLGMGGAWLAAQRWHWRLGIALGMAWVPVYVWAGSFALLHYGKLFGARIGERLESAQNPFTAGNDQMAHVLWFQDAAAESGGFGLGHTPWCGELTGVCRGVPVQIQSDYMYTALAGVFGPWVSGLLLLVFALWLWRLARFHLAGTSGRVESDDLGQAWLSWMTLCWVGLTLTQLAVTVAGNRAWLPLTGITFPFLSYGAWSLLSNALFLGLALNVNAFPTDRRGLEDRAGLSEGNP